MEQRGRFQLHLPGLLKVLAEHLYSAQKVGVRELLQNAHDSCLRRAIEDPDERYRPHIEIRSDPATHRLSFLDNGSGLTEQEILTYLTVIGRGYTRELRERLAIDEAEAARGLIGQFGIGFLSAYLLASGVAVETRSKGGPPLRWQSAGDEEFDISEGSRAEIGTTVELRLKPPARFLLRDQALVEVVREYADFLPTPVYIEGWPDRVNLGRYPWDEPDPERACRDYIKVRFREPEPLWVLPLCDGSVDLGHDSLSVPLRGVLFIPARSVVSVKEYGSLAVYIRGMAICDEDKDLLPPWARFVRGIIDSPALQPTASREGVHQDESFEYVRRVLNEQLNRGLAGLATGEPATWRRVVYAHSDLIVGWASKDDDFFRLVADSVPLGTSRGRMSLPEYLRATSGVAYYTTHQLGSLQDKVLAEARDVPAIDASWFGVREFLERYASRRRDVVLTRLDDTLESLMRPAPPGDHRELVDLCEALGFAVAVSSFRPVELPAIMTYPADAETLRDAASALDQDLIPDGFSALLRGYVEARGASAGSVGTLHLNASNPLIESLRDPGIPPDRKKDAVEVVALFARLFCGRMLGAEEATADLGAWQSALQRLVRP
jgi:molecular chaperone HtpG